MKRLILVLLLSGPLWAQNLSAVQIKDPVVLGGAETRAEIVLESPAASEDVWVELSANGPVHVPMAVRIPAGQRSAQVTVLTDPTGSDVQIQIRATLRGAGPAVANLKVVGERSAQK